MTLIYTEYHPLKDRETAQVSHLGGKRQKEGGIVCSALGCRYHTLGSPAITGAAIPRWLAKVLNVLCMGIFLSRRSQCQHVMPSCGARNCIFYTSLKVSNAAVITALR